MGSEISIIIILSYSEGNLVILGTSYSWCLKCSVVSVTLKKKHFCPYCSYCSLTLIGITNKMTLMCPYPDPKETTVSFYLWCLAFWLFSWQSKWPTFPVRRSVPPQHSCGAHSCCSTATTYPRVPASPAAGSSAEALGRAGAAFSSPSQ